MKSEWQHFFRHLPEHLKTPEITNLPAQAHGIPEGFLYRTTYHLMGTCRMGSSRLDSVVDHELRTWDHANLFIVGSSVFPTSGTANPTVTLAALALRTADAILRQLA